ncbi:MAG TPA: fused MFS/spermidine synthase, partial [Dongiaceae bacterium]|nr:fused MFS/spermidine synthase [Dongiaceae bacterium]
MTFYYLVIFITGGATLALEVLASRILTPYYGVSLYIWTAILSITLTFLAVGYYAGGGLARQANQRARRLWYFVAPSASAVAITLACLAYPWLFPALVTLPLALASLLAATLLLAVPLIVLSAMNPLLIAIRPGSVGDAGAGRV